MATTFQQHFLGQGVKPAADTFRHIILADPSIEGFHLLLPRTAIAICQQHEEEVAEEIASDPEVHDVEPIQLKQLRAKKRSTDNRTRGDLCQTPLVEQLEVCEPFVPPMCRQTAILPRRLSRGAPPTATGSRRSLPPRESEYLFHGLPIAANFAQD